MSKIGIVNYGSGNVRSLLGALDNVGVQSSLVSEPTDFSNFDKFILPGVGAFATVKRKLDKTGLTKSIIQIFNEQIPLLGICVGMQMFLDSSEEFGRTPGLGLISGSVEKLPEYTQSEDRNLIPHVGWSRLSNLKKIQEEKSFGNLFNGVGSESYFYFVHSFVVRPTCSNMQICTTTFGGEEIVAGVCSGKLFGLQFHPEKSGAAGLKVLQNFARL